MKFLSLAFCLFLAACAVQAQSAVWRPSPGHVQVPIWPGTPPDAQPATGPEVVGTPEHSVAGKPWQYVRSVSQPTLTVYSPSGNNTGVAVVVFPGGGYEILAIDLEGSEVCDWLTSRGITCVLLKYRVPGEKGYPKSAPYPKSGPYPESPLALEDAQRTLGLARLHAAEWHIDPHKIGVLGFSAGGHLVVAASTNFEKRLYPAVDAADQQSCRPDFAVALYPGHLTVSAKKWDVERGGKKYVVPQWVAGNPDLSLNPDIHVTRETPPTFIVQAEDDPVDAVQNSIVYFLALKQAGVPAEMHLFAHGGHAFGLRPTKFPITNWPRLVESWLHSIAMLPN